MGRLPKHGFVGTVINGNKCLLQPQQFDSEYFQFVVMEPHNTILDGYTGDCYLNKKEMIEWALNIMGVEVYYFETLRELGKWLAE